MPGQRGVIMRGILVEQPAHIGFGHRRSGFAGAEPRQLQPRAVVVRGVGIAGLPERRDRAVAVAEPVADGAEREPGGRELRRKLHRLHKNIGGGGKIAT